LYVNQHGGSDTKFNVIYNSIALLAENFSSTSIESIDEVVTTTSDNCFFFCFSDIKRQVDFLLLRSDRNAAICPLNWWIWGDTPLLWKYEVSWAGISSSVSNVRD